ncbi:Putative lipid-binding protein AIR1B [Linum perenne]
MASSKTTTSALALFLSLNLLFFSATKVNATCDPASLDVCVDLLNSLLKITLNQPSSTPCCSLINGVADLDAAVCVCAALKNNILGALGLLNLNQSLIVLLNKCGKAVPAGYYC